MLAGLGLLAASCAEDIEPSTPQKNPAEPILKVDDLAVEKAGVLAAEAGTVVKLDDYFSADLVPAMKVIKEENVPAGGELLLKLEISKTADFADYRAIDMKRGSGEADGDILYVPTSEWDAAQIELFGKTDKPVHTYYRVPEYVALGGTDYRVNNPDYYVAEGEIDVKRCAFGYVVEQNYYVFGTYLGNNVPANGTLMLHNEDADVYDDPVFTYFFNVTEEQAATGYTLRVAPESVVKTAGAAADCYGMGRDKGALELGGPAIVINEAGPYKFEVNMQSLTYEIAVAPTSLYVPTSGATFTAKCLAIPTDNFVNYNGFAYIKDQFRLTGQKGWKPVQYGAGDDEFGTDIVLGSSNWLKLPEKSPAGLYYLQVNTVKLNYTAIAVESLGMIGSFNDWDEAKDVEMKHNANFNVWTGELTLEAGAEFKLRANKAWNVQVGSAKGASNIVTPGTAYETLTTNDGGTLLVTEAGTYTVTFDCSTLPYKLTLTKK